jgi:hypothetical protein
VHLGHRRVEELALQFGEEASLLVVVTGDPPVDLLLERLIELPDPLSGEPSRREADLRELFLQDDRGAAQEPDQDRRLGLVRVREVETPRDAIESAKLGGFPRCAAPQGLGKLGKRRCLEYRIAPAGLLRCEQG